MSFFYDLFDRLNKIQQPEAKQLNESKMSEDFGPMEEEEDAGTDFGDVKKSLKAKLEKSKGIVPEDASGGAFGTDTLEEKWDTETDTPESKKGMFAGKTRAELMKQLNKLKDSGPHKRGSKEFTKMKELQFAIRAKSGWGKVKEDAKATQYNDDHAAPDYEHACLGEEKVDLSRDPAEPNLDAIAKRKAREEARRRREERAEADLDDLSKDVRSFKTAPSPSTRTVAGKAYGGALQRDDDEETTVAPGTGEKRGRGRPKGTGKKMGAQMTGTRKIKEHGSGVENMKGKSWQSSKQGAHPWNAVNEDTSNRDLADQIAQLLDKGAKVDSRVVGAMGHITRAEGTHITLAKLNKPTSKIRYSWMITPERAEGLEIVKAGPNHYVIRDTDAAWGEPQQSLGLDTPAEGKMLESVSRKHFQQVADLLKNIDDPEKRKELAMHHADIFKAQNPRFDLGRFLAAAGVDVTEGIGGSNFLEAAKPDFLDLDKDSNKTEPMKQAAKQVKETDNLRSVPKAELQKHLTQLAGEVAMEYGAGSGIKKSDLSQLAQHAMGLVADGMPLKAVKRELIKLVKSSQLSEKSVSQAQARMMAGAAHDPAFAKKVGVSQSVAKEFNKADKGTKISKLPKHVDEDSTDDKRSAQVAAAGKAFNSFDAYKKGEATAKRDNRAERAGKKVTKDIEYDEKKKKVKETTCAGSVATVAAKGNNTMGGIVGQGVYESLNAQVEKLITESFNVTINDAVSDQGDATKSVSVSASGDQAEQLLHILKMAGLDSAVNAGPQNVEVEVEPVATEVEICGECGQQQCECAGDVEMMEEGYGDVDVAENNPDWPSNEEESDDALQYSGGLNGPKSTGQTTVPVIASQLNRQMTAESEDSMLSLYKRVISI